MKSIKNQFNADILDLKEHLKFIKDVEHLIPESEINLRNYSQSNKKKKEDYKGIIISLYGLLENHIEKLIKKYLEYTEFEIEYNHIKPKIAENHFVYSIKLIDKVIEGRFSKYDHLHKEKLVENLSLCKDGSIYKLNQDAFTIASGNLKHEKICDVFSLVDIPLKQKIKDSSEYVNSDSAFSDVDDLVIRRNVIAHGVFIDDLLDKSELNLRINFIKDYFNNIFEIVYKDLLNEIYQYKISQNIFIEINAEDRKIYSSSLFGYIGRELYIGDYMGMLIKKGDNTFRRAKIETMKFFPNIGTTIKIDVDFKDNHILYLIPIAYVSSSI